MNVSQTRRAFSLWPALFLIVVGSGIGLVGGFWLAKRTTLARELLSGVQQALLLRCVVG
jgi:hypothetical protein